MGLENLLKKGKNYIRRALIAAGLTSSLLFLTSCPSPIPPPIPTPGKENELSENTQVLSQEELAQISSMGDNYIEFFSTQTYSPGDIIIADITNKTPEGFLRKVDYIEGTIVYTQQATIEEAVKNGNFTSQKKLSPSDARLVSTMKGVSEVAPKSSVDFNLNINLYDPDTNITAEGNISFNSDLILGVEIEDSHINKLTFKNLTTEYSKLELTALSSFGNIVDKKFSIARYDFSPFAVYLPTVPPFPIVIVPKLEVYVGVKGNVSPVKADITQTATLTTGLVFENGSWNKIKDFSNSFNFSPVSFAEILNLKAYAGPQLSFPLYGVAGPYGELNGYLNLKLDSSLNWLELYGGLEANLGVDMRIFSRTMLDFSTNVIDYSKLLERWERPTPPPPTPITIAIQPGPEGEDAWIRYVLYPDGLESYYGYDTDPLEIRYNFIGSHGIADESLIQFPLSSIPSNSNITSAKLKLYGYGSSNYIGVDPKFRIKEIISSWNESTVKWNTKPSYGDYIATCTLPKDEIKWHEWDITSLVQDWVNGQTNYGLVLLTTGNEEYGKFKSSDYLDDESKRPILEVSYYE